jgi:hypothetical protein
MYTKALLILWCALPIGAVAQTQWLIFGGPQFDQVTYRPPKDTDQVDRWSSYHLTFSSGSGMGWHIGGALRTGKEKVMFRTGLTLTRSSVSVPYKETSRNGGLGGGASAVSTGQLDDVFTLIEAPMLISLGIQQIRLEIGFAPWMLVNAYSHDSGVRNSAWWNILPQSGTNSSTYDQSGDATQKFVPYGVMGSFGLTGVIKKHFLAGVSGTFNLPRTYESDSDYSVARMMLRFSIGYVFTQK